MFQKVKKRHKKNKIPKNSDYQTKVSELISYLLRFLCFRLGEEIFVENLIVKKKKILN